jgi:hypothetical protein
MEIFGQLSVMDLKRIYYAKDRNRYLFLDWACKCCFRCVSAVIERAAFAVCTLLVSGVVAKKGISGKDD